MVSQEVVSIYHLVMERCQYCPHFVSNDYEALVKHLYQFHSNASNLTLRCRKGGCPQTFRNFSSRRAHISKNHKEQALEQPRIENVAQIHVAEEVDHNDEAVHVGELDGVNAQENLSQLQKDAEAEFLLALRAKCVTQPIVKCVIDNSEIFVQACLRNCLGKVQTVLSDNGINLGDYLDIDEIIKEHSTVFSDVKTAWKHNSYVKRCTDAIEPIQKDFVRRIIRGPVGNVGENRKSKVHSDKYVYIPILKIIARILSHPDYPTLILNDDKVKDSFRQSYKDCPYFSSHELFKDKPDALQIFLYYDDVNLVDTASSRPVSMSYFYFTLANIHPRFRSSLNFIHLVAATEAENLKIDSNRFNDILSDLVADLIKLENGVDINGTKVYGTVVAFLGDNLAQHKVGGFKEGFTAIHSCRYCMFDLDDLNYMTREDETLFRTPDQYNEQVLSLEAAPNKVTFERLSKSFGLNRGSILNSLKYFHVVGGLMPDVFHDHLHLQIGVHLQLLLRHFLVGTSKVMKLVDFNDALAQHDYGYSQTKPSQVLEPHVKAGGNLHQTGSQIWSLAWTIPFILGPKVDFFDEYWCNYLQLLQISTLLMAIEVSDAMIEHLYFLIEEYYSKFLELYEEKHLVARQHYLLHAPGQMKNMGPLYQYITLRWEGAHQKFKDDFKKLKCFKNPSLTSARQHELKQAHLFKDSLVKKEVQGPVKIKSRLDLEYSNLLPENVNAIHSVSWVEIFGVKYTARKCFVLLNVENNLPNFGLIQDIVYIDEKPVFVCKLIHTVHKELHLSSYEVRVQMDYKLVKYDEMASWIVYHSHTVDNKLYIPIRRSIGGLM